MHVGHEGKNPYHGILGGLAKTSPNRSILTLSNSVDGHARNGEVSLFLCEPPGVVGEVGKEEESDNRDEESDNTLEDEQPLPSRDSSDVS